VRDQDHAPAAGGVAQRIPDQRQQRIGLIDDVQRRVRRHIDGPASSHLRNPGEERLAPLSPGDDSRIDAMVPGDLSHDGLVQVTETELLGKLMPDGLTASPIHLRQRNGTVAHDPSRP